MILELLSYSFVQRAIISGMCAGILLAVLGIFVTLKRMSFFSDGVAHASLVGVALGLLFHREPLIYAVIFSVVFAIAIFFLEQKTTIATDSLLAILFTSSLALGIVLINLQSGFQPDLISYLFGNILTIRTFEVWLIAGLSVLIAGFIYWKYRTYLLLSLNEEVAALAGIHTKSYQLLLYVILAVATVLSIKVLGINNSRFIGKIIGRLFEAISYTEHSFFRTGHYFRYVYVISFEFAGRFGHCAFGYFFIYLSPCF